MSFRTLLRTLPALVLIAFAAPANAGDWDDCPKVADPARAVPACTRIIGSEKNKGKLAIAYANRCGAHNAKYELKVAKADCDKAIELNPGYVGGYLNRGNTYLKMKEFDRAIENYNKAIDINPKVAIAYANRGQAHGRKGEKARAIADFEESVRLAPNNLNNRHGLVVSLIKGGKFGQARDHVWRLIQVKPTSFLIQKYALQVGKKTGDKALMAVALALVEKYTPDKTKTARDYLKSP
jgi:tetratricopeptide (TPR) repeat protein